MQITKEIRCHTGHIVSSQVEASGKPGKCAQMAHGHTYRIIATINGMVVQDSKPNGGMIVDFSNLKKVMMDIIYAEADHAFYIWKEDTALESMRSFSTSPGKNPAKLHIVDFVPTAENLAKHWFELLEIELRVNYHIQLSRLEVFETPTSSAIYEPEPEIPARVQRPLSEYIY